MFLRTIAEILVRDRSLGNTDAFTVLPCMAAFALNHVFGLVLVTAQALCYAVWFHGVISRAKINPAEGHVVGSAQRPGMRACSGGGSAKSAPGAHGACR